MHGLDTEILTQWQCKSIIYFIHFSSGCPDLAGAARFSLNLNMMMMICMSYDFRGLIFFICSDDIREIREKRMQSKF